MGRSQPRIRNLDNPGGSRKDSARAQSAAGTASRRHTGKMREHSSGDGLIFPSVTGKALSDATLSKLLREQGIQAVPHGFRSSFRDWCGETGQPREVAEACLAHAVKNKVEAAYARSDLLNRRRKLMRVGRITSRPQLKHARCQCPSKRLQFHLSLGRGSVSVGRPLPPPLCSYN